MIRGNQSTFYSKGGFTALEVLMVIAIMGILVTLGAGTFSRFHHKSVFAGEMKQVTTLLTEARQDTLSSLDKSQYGVHVENGKVTIFKGDTYVALDPNNRETTLNPLVEISTIALNGGGDNIVFKKLTGETDYYGNLTMRLVSNPAYAKNIIITTTGLIDAN